MGEPIRDLQDRAAFVLHYTRETTRPIMGSGSNEEPPFSNLNPWMPDQQEPEDYDVRVEKIIPCEQQGFYCDFYV